MEIRKAEKKDVKDIFNLIKELALYEKALESVEATEELIHESLFGENAKTFALVVTESDKVIAYAVYFYSYSTWLGKKGIYLEDLYVKQEFRGTGIGTNLIKTLAQKCVEENCGRLEWACLDWNTPSREFYENLGAKENINWLTYRLSGEGLNNFAQNKNGR